LKPGGEIVLVSRVGAEAGLRRALERWFAPAARKLGWRTEFSWERYADWAKRSRGMRLVERRAMPPFGHFSLIPFPKGGGTAPRARGDAGRAPLVPPPLFPPNQFPSPPIDAPVTSDSSNRHSIDTR